MFKRCALTVFLLLSLYTFLPAQKNILVLEKARSGRNMKLYVRDAIQVQSSSSENKISGYITAITDSSIVINYSNELIVSDITAVYTKRWGFQFLQKLMLISGVTYLVLSAGNGAVNGDDEIVSQETLAICGGLIAGGLLLIPLVTRIHDIENGKWKIKLLDFTH